MENMWQETRLGSLSLKNRFVRSATFEGLGKDDGSCTDKIPAFYRRLSTGNIGLIISGHLFVHPHGQAGPMQLGISKDDYIPGLSELVQACHHGQAKVLAQLSHAGAHAMPVDRHLPKKAPSTIDFGDQGQSEAMTLDDIDETIHAFASAALRAKQAGFDGIQLHGAHGYLLSQFLSPWYNRRTDNYGGSLENRARLLKTILQEVRKNVGTDYPVVLKINGQDYLKGDVGLSIADSLATIKCLEPWLDAIEISGGCGISDRALTPVRPVNVRDDALEDVYHIAAAEAFKGHLNIPIILVGGIKSLNVASQLVKQKLADLIAFSRPLICEPNLIRRWQESDTSPSRCVRCTKCFKTLRSGDGVYCAVQQNLKH